MAARRLKSVVGSHAQKKCMAGGRGGVEEKKIKLR
jgi:hypothetical protein